jgi:hypothetical protein
MTVDEFVESKVLPEFQPVVAAIRSLMKVSAPDAEELMSQLTGRSTGPCRTTRS